MENLFHQLNERQIEAVTATEGYVRIIAGAGSGKTKTLTHRYAYLVRAAGIHPGNILCVTFTNKAAGEMKRRVRALVGDGYDTSLITTYHGFCVRVLREDVGRLFWPQSFQILSEWDQRKILEEIYAELEIKLDRASFEKILDTIHQVKSTEEYVDHLVCGDFAVPMPDQKDGEPVEKTVIQRYLEKQKKAFGLDFDDLIAFTFEIFQKYPNVLEKWQERLHYIQVDEFQDSSFRELRLIRMLSDLHRNLFVVGDPDQNIYEWRGADMSILVDFDKEFPGTRTILLNQNYRSTGNILKAANTLIAHNRRRIPKDLFTVGAAGEDVIHLHAKSETEEGKWMAAEIKRLVEEKSCLYREVAVLYRSGFLSRFLEQALTAASIPYELYGGLRFYDRMEIRDAVAYLRLVAGNDDSALSRIINTPKRMFGKRKMELLRSMAEKEGRSLYETLAAHLDDPDFRRTEAKALVLAVEEARRDCRTRPVSDVMEDILTKSGYERYIRENGSMERLDNLSEFKRMALELERNEGEFYSLEDFLQYVALQAERDGDETETDKVKLMTVHASKGLEFPVCFVCGLTDGVFPSGRTLEERKDAGLEEERRLCFVALTRAMRRLYLTESEGESQDGGNRKKQPSRFLFEIGEENYRRIGVLPKELAGGGNTAMATQTESAIRPVGSVVEHPVFGRGIIVEVREDKRVYAILFEKTNVVKPVDMDYDFEAWKNLEEMRRQAIEAAREQTSKAESSKEESSKAELSGTESSTAESSKPEPSKPAALQQELPGLTLGAGPDAAREGKTEPAAEEHILPAGDFFSLLPDAAVPAPEGTAPAEAQAPAPEQPKKPRTVPPQYREEDWANAVDKGEENLWKRSDVPHEGWTCIDVIDLGEPVGVCRMCGHQIIRYVHVMFHPSYPKRIGAGCVCAGRMEGNPERAKERENAFKNRLARRETFLHLPLKRSRNGNEYIKYKEEFVTILRDKFREGYFKAVFRNEYSPSYKTKEEALADVFDRLDPPVKMGE